MIYTFIFLLFLILVIAYSLYTAPYMDEDTGRVIKPGKKLSDLFKKQKK
jgi:hypothetical protein